LEQILLHKRIPLLGELELEKILPLEEVDQIPARKGIPLLGELEQSYLHWGIPPLGELEHIQLIEGIPFLGEWNRSFATKEFSPKELDPTPHFFLSWVSWNRSVSMKDEGILSQGTGSYSTKEFLSWVSWNRSVSMKEFFPRELEQILLHKRIPLLGELEQICIQEEILPLEELDQISAQKRILFLGELEQSYLHGGIPPLGELEHIYSLKEFLSWVSWSTSTPMQEFSVDELK